MEFSEFHRIHRKSLIFKSFAKVLLNLFRQQYWGGWKELEKQQEERGGDMPSEDSQGEGLA